MQALTKLKALDLSQNDCGDQGLDQLLHQDLLSTELDSLCLNGNRLGPGERCPSCASRCRWLLTARWPASEALAAGQRAVNSHLCAAVSDSPSPPSTAAARSIGRCRAAARGLQRLDIAENWLRNEGVEVLAELLGEGKLSRLAHLDIARNGVGAEGAQALASVFGRGAAPCLQVLNLNMNWIGPQGAAALASSLGCLTKLARLAVSQNELQSEGGIRLFVGLGACRELTHLDVSSNALGQLAVPQLRLPPKLCHLDLADNALRDAGSDTLAGRLASAAGCGALEHLGRVDLRLNELSEAALPALEQLVACCPRLRTLDVRGNGIRARPRNFPQVVV